MASSPRARWLVLAPYARGPDAPGTRAPGPVLDLHVSRQARERFGLDSSLFSFAGRLVVADIQGARRLAETLAAELAEVDQELAQTITPGRLYALGLIHELLHGMIERYRGEVAEAVLSQALSWLEGRLGTERLGRTLETFAQEFPPLAVWRGEQSLDEYLEGATAGRANREILLEEMLLLWLANRSPAFAPFRELFDDGRLRRETAYPELVAGLEEFLAEQPPFPEAAGAAPQPAPRSLFAALLAPAEDEPMSLSGQLRQVIQTAPPPPGPAAVRVLRGTDFLREEERPIFPPGPGPAFSAPAPVLPPGPAASSPGLVAEGPEQFTLDRDWMPNLTLIAKSTLVWLFQLSRQYGREITRLDQIPDGELERLARQGFTGLWLIGVWERSEASRKIKQATGNPDAAPSAYALDSYAVAARLGGDEALADLAARATRFGLRLGCDMVPNHFGIDSAWVRDHPERFLQVAEPPYRAYRYTGPDLSSTPELGLWIEDHYYDRTDAAVVFKRLDRTTGEASYLYHGNDGTVTPWNDTAQLDYLQADVREAVIEVILEVARRFPIIRFDAAMTLARRHVQRLWFPLPGTAGDIPSRAEHGLTQEEFDAAMPEEFFRQVVDRVAAEAPETLLLAEAFWLMENYFVRSLGMHRVYNSAFMILLRDEGNASYRKAIKDVLAFDREILQRYVNFMSNPDERTAVDQFGKSDKYFGVCTLMATLPGLPMFGHGQVEGFAERYGMEYGRSYLDEKPDPWLAARHERQIFPLLHRRRLFAGAERFVLYDFEKAPGQVDEDVFAFSNQHEDERALVVFHNRPGPTRGRLRRSVPYAVKTPGQTKPQLKWQTLAQALGLAGEAAAAPASEAVTGETATGKTAGSATPGSATPAAPAPLLLTCRDAMTGLEHLFDPREIVGAGLGLSLGGYQCHVFLDFQPIVEDADGRWRALAAHLGSRGVPSLAEALLEPTLEAVLGPFRDLVEPELLRRWVQAPRADAAARAELVEETASRFATFTEALAAHRAEEVATPAPPQEARPRERVPDEALEGDLGHAFAVVATLGGDGEAEAAPEEPPPREIAEEPEADLPSDTFAAWLRSEPGPLPVLVLWRLLRRLGAVAVGTEAVDTEAGDDGGGGDAAVALLDELLLGRQIVPSLRTLGLAEAEAGEAVQLLEILLAGELPPLAPAGETAWLDLATWTERPRVRRFLRLNRYDGKDWLHRESLAILLRWAVLDAALAQGPESPAAQQAFERATALASGAAAVGYELTGWVASEETKLDPRLASRD